MTTGFRNLEDFGLTQGNFSVGKGSDSLNAMVLRKNGRSTIEYS